MTLTRGVNHTIIRIQSFFSNDKQFTIELETWFEENITIKLKIVRKKVFLLCRPPFFLVVGGGGGGVE